ncbi:MAG: helix-turn-helix domain-containing protein [Treponema sp.]|jgi:transcriptional regulator with XRE-family HTH domain|nr:helix-turn-helix domain-containing protein [Treponema sp.]
MSFRENLRETLDFISIEQKELAAKTGLSLKTIENYVKKDSSIPSADKAVLIAQALGVTVEYLVSGKESEKYIKNIITIKDKELMDTLSKLNNYNYDVITSMAKILLNFQMTKKPTKV